MWTRCVNRALPWQTMTYLAKIITIIIIIIIIYKPQHHAKQIYIYLRTEIYIYLKYKIYFVTFLSGIHIYIFKTFSSKKFERSNLSVLHYNFASCLIKIVMIRNSAIVYIFFLINNSCSYICFFLYAELIIFMYVKYFSYIWIYTQVQKVIKGYLQNYLIIPKLFKKISK